MERHFIGFEDTILTKRTEYLKKGDHYYIEYLHSQNQELLEMAIKCWDKSDELWGRLCKYWEREGAYRAMGMDPKQEYFKKILEIEA